MDMDKIIDDIVKAKQKLSEIKAYEEHRANGDITDLVSLSVLLGSLKELKEKTE